MCILWCRYCYIQKLWETLFPIIQNIHSPTVKYGGHCLRYGLTLVGKNYLFFLHIMEDTAPDNVFRIRSIHAPERAVLAGHPGSLQLNWGRMSLTPKPPTNRTTGCSTKWRSKLKVFLCQPLQGPQLVRAVEFDRLVV